MKDFLTDVEKKEVLSRVEADSNIELLYLAKRYRVTRGVLVEFLRGEPIYRKEQLHNLTSREVQAIKSYRERSALVYNNVTLARYYNVAVRVIDNIAQTNESRVQGFTTEQVERIKATLRTGVATQPTFREIAKEFGLSARTVRSIFRGEYHVQKDYFYQY